ncbi:S8 family serine peptidase [Sorangium sp. So ce693]|uniref:S8 family serine peptidase n=1 Tax=Sorangium sp. So ce693 TaxID=3133318 RepID=UPI003F63B19F
MKVPPGSGAKVQPRTFFLNEKQELASFDRDGGGGQVDYVPIDWSARSAGLSASFRRATTPPARSADPSVGRHFFVVAVPVHAVQKRSQAKTVPGGIKHEAPAFGGEQSHLFRKLGMDLIETLPGGKAAVHVLSTRTEQLLSTIASLPGASSREKARWINFETFEPLDWTARVSMGWVETLHPGAVVEVVIRFQPALTRLEVNDVLQSMARVLDDKHSRLTKAGREFSGRYWCAGFLTREFILAVAREFSSVQSIHPPIRSPVAMARKGRRPLAPGASMATSNLPTLPPSELPTVAIVDCGIPEKHVHLAPYRRSGFRNPDIDPVYPYLGSHGSHVASCAVFGRLNMNGGIQPPPPGRCRVIDVMVAHDAGFINSDLVVPAMDAIVGTAPDVRVFNLSVGSAPLDTLDPVTRREHLMKLQDLDNFAFARDVLLVIAAGNSTPGLSPKEAYPNHVDDPRWGLGFEARTFNGIVSGAYVDVLVPDSVAGIVGAPSPFTRIGPGLCGSPVPGFSAPGGDCSEGYAWAPGTGPWVCDAEGNWEDSNGTSLAAPLVAREAAWVIKDLAQHCAPTVAPFSSTVKAWLNLVAQRPRLPGAFERLAQRTLGKGFPTAERLRAPIEHSAVFIWQTMLQAAKSVNRAQLPVPAEWLRKASTPTLRIVCAWSTPVNSALVDSWACRKVSLRVRPFGGEAALRGGGNASGAYPLIDRLMDISPKVLEEKGIVAADAPWIIEVEYEEIGAYPPAMTVSAQQRVGVVIELFDAGENATSPQAAIQALPVAMDMLRLSVLQQPIQTPIVIRT